MTVSAQIYEWVPGYLAWLNLGWQPKGRDHHMSELNRAATLLAEDVPLWSAAIRDQNWRPPLIGAACVIATRDRRFFDDLCYRFEQGSFVAPQIAVALGLVHPSEAQAFFRDQLGALTNDPKRLVAAQTVLSKLGMLKESDIALSGWSSMDQDEAEIGHAVVCGHWDFWREVT